MLLCCAVGFRIPEPLRFTQKFPKAARCDVRGQARRFVDSTNSGVIEIRHEDDVGYDWRRGQNRHTAMGRSGCAVIVARRCCARHPRAPWTRDIIMLQSCAQEADGPRCVATETAVFQLQYGEIIVTCSRCIAMPWLQATYSRPYNCFKFAQIPSSYCDIFLHD
jgi:hypothetical protein